MLKSIDLGLLGGLGLVEGMVMEGQGSYGFLV
jgi:hypothetical protein